MKQIQFKKLIIKNFLSVGETPVTIDFKPGLHIITGINKDKVNRRNGVGKSTISDALYFALYGNTLRELKKEFIANNISSGKCEVCLIFDVKDKQSTIEYKIVRLLNPTKCYIYKDGKDFTRDTINNTTEYINKLINTSEDVFQNCVIMTINNTIPFMGKKRIDKRKFIEGILNLEIFSSMVNILRNDYNDTRKELDTECTILDEVGNSIRTYKEQKELHENNKSNKLKKYKSRQIDNEEELKKIENNIKKIKIIDSSEYRTKHKILTDRLDTCNIKISHAVSEIAGMKANIKLHIEQIETLSNTSNKPICPTCLREIHSDDKNHIQEEKNKIKKIIRKLKAKIDEEEETASKYKEVQEQLQIKIEKNSELVNQAIHASKQIDELKGRKEQLRNWQRELKQDIEELESQSSQFQNIIEETEHRIQSIKSNISNIKGEIKDLDIVKFIVSEEGVKSYIVKKILELLNSKLAYYLKKMDSNCILFFNEYFEEQIVDDKGKICSYNNFSGAERKNIDLACLFTFMDIRRLQGDVSFNLSMYDELFDSSLDEKGVDLVVNILTERLEKYNECMYVISHRKESVNFATRAEIRNGDVVFLQKENGITTRVAFDREKFNYS